MKVVGVTKCTMGIAHTYIAAERLEKYGEKLGYSMRVEAQGAQETENALLPEEIASADYVVIAADVEIDRGERFDGKMVFRTPIRPVLTNASGILERLPELASVQKISEKTDESAMYIKGKADGEGQNISAVRQLMSGASYMIPFVIVGGLFISLSLAFGAESSSAGLVISSVFWSKINAIGVLAFSLMYPIFSGFLAFSIAGRAALAPAMIGALIAVDGEILGTGTGTGILGCIIVGYMAGYLVKWMNTWKPPKALRSMMPIFIIPLFGAGFIAAVFIGILGQPISMMMTGLNSLLVLLSVHSSAAVWLGLVLGAMIGVDMGGPINKVAFLFGVTSIAEGSPQIMGIAAAAIPVAPLAMGTAALIGKNKFTSEEQNAGIYTILMGLLGVSEGAIPYASADPTHVIPSVTIGSSAAGAVASLFHVSVSVPHGGPIVGALGASSDIFLYCLSILAGTAVAVFLILLIKPILPRP